MDLFTILFALLIITQNAQNPVNGHVIMNSRLNFFDFDLIRSCVEDGNHANVVISPASIKSVLAMLLEGAGGKTAAEMISALRLSPDKIEFREQFNRYLTALKRESNKTNISNANGVFVSDKLKLNPEYEIMMKNVYLSEVLSVDFRNPVTAANVTNSWVSQKTRGLITEIVKPVDIDPFAKVLIANAIYFKSSWLNSFNKGFTRRACFYRKDACQKVDMMHLKAELKYAFVDNLRAQAIELPYSDERYSMILLVPQDKDGWSTLIRDLPYVSLPQISALMTYNDVELTLPKFTVKYSEDIVDVLRKMRINELFSSSSNMSGIFEGREDMPHVNGFYHQVFLQVDEEGTVASAATGAIVAPLINNVVTLTVNRPFIFFITDTELGLVLFAGKIEEPGSSGVTQS